MTPRNRITIAPPPPDKPPTRRGRPTILPDVQAPLLALIEQGNYLTTAAQTLGISPDNIHNWISRGEREAHRQEQNLTAQQRRHAGHPPAASEAVYVQFFRAVRAAQARAETRIVRRLDRAMEGGAVVREVTRRSPDGTVETEVSRTAPDVRAMMFVLERTRAAGWGRRQALEVSGPEGRPVQITYEDEASLAHRLEAAAAARTRELENVVDAEIVEPERP